MNQYIRNLIYLLVVPLLIITLLFNSVHAQPNYNDLAYPWLSDSTSCGTASTTAASNKNVYVIGDSLTVGMRDAGGLQGKLQQAGWTVQNIEATDSITTEGSLPKLDQDKAQIQQAGTIVVALGTNKGSNFQGNLTKFVQTLKADAPSAQIYWMNAYTKAANYDDINGVIAAQASSLGYKVIDWKQEATSNPNPYPFVGDGIHHTAAGYQAKADFLVKNLSLATPSSSAPTGQVEEYIFWFLVSKGLTKEQASGILGNWWAESSLIPSEEEKGGGGGYGLAQWTGGRRTALEAAAKKAGVPVSDLNFQLNYFWQELNGPEKASLVDLQKQTTVEGATLSFLTQNERADPAKSNQAKRVTMAQKVFATYSNKTPPAGLSIPASSSGGSDCATPSGGNTANGFVVYSQFDPKWTSKPYGSSTVGASGAGPSSVAMAITALTGKSVTPDVIAASYGRFYDATNGSSWDLFTTAPKDYNLNATDIGKSMDMATQAIQNGGLVIAAGQGPKPFTSGGHFLVIKGVTASGTLLIGDPGHDDTSSVEWQPDQLAASIRNMWVITK